MNDMELGLLETINRKNNIQCNDSLCTRVVAFDEDCFKDFFNGGKILCFQCGLCVRYARKKAKQRKENIEKIIID